MRYRDDRLRQTEKKEKHDVELTSIISTIIFPASLWENHEPIKQNQTQHDKEYTVLRRLQKTKTPVQRDTSQDHTRCTHLHLMPNKSVALSVSACQVSLY